MRVGKLEGRSGDNIQTEAQGRGGAENEKGHTVKGFQEKGILVIRCSRNEVKFTPHNKPHAKYLLEGT